jgi:ABC-type transport system substrate-binding protein
MKTSTTIALAAAVLLSGATVASAASMQPKASDKLNLSSTQQKTAWRDLYMKSMNQTVPSGFNPTIGAVVPNSVTTAPVPTKAASAVPALRPYDFAQLKNKLVIVNPTDKKIAEVISG